VGVSDLTAIGAGSPDSSGVAAVQARIAQIQSLFGGSTPSFSSALASASTDTSASTGSSTSDATDAASMASSLGLDPSVVSALAGASGSSGTSATAAATGTSAAGATGGTKASQVIAEARKYLGVKYVWGGESPTGFDCSGLVQYVYKKFGVNLPRVSQDQAHAGKAVSAADAKAGDLVFYHNPATHVGIYLGNGMMLDAPNSKSVVRVEKLWSGVSGFRRVLPDSAVTAPAAAARTASSGTAAAGGSVGALAAKLPAAGKQYASAIVSAANKNGVPPALLAAVVWQESNFNARAVSPAGAKGLVQLMPATARGLGVDPMNPTQALDGGARYLKQQLNTFGGRTDLALAAYNAGPSAVRRYGGVPPYKETQHYVSVIENKMSALSKAA
jgi:cell wall-associated NlpC family hydrolase